jgi:integrase
LATEKITKRLVDSTLAQAKSEERTIYTWDTDLTGFGFVATKTGRASYFIEYRLGGRGTQSKRVTIGKHGALTPDEARKAAKDRLGEVAKGRDVAQERKDTRRKLAAGTFRDAVEKYLSLNGKTNKSWSETRRLLEYDAVKALGSKPMVSVTRADVAELLDDTAQRSHSVARALFAALRPMFRWCRDRGIIEVNSISDLKGPAPLASRDRVLDREEIKAFWRATDAIGWPFGPVYKLLLLTGQRCHEEVAAMTWREVDLAKTVWTIPADHAKNGREHEVDLSPQALAVLDSLLFERKGLVFTTTGKTAVSGFSHVKARIDTLMTASLGRELKPWRNHDLRRTMATLMGEELEIDPGVIERVLNHISGSQGGLQGIYQRQQYRQKRKQALHSWGAWIEQLTADKQNTSNVIPITKMAK